MEEACSSEMSVAFQRTTWRYIPEDSTRHNHIYDNLKSYIRHTGFSFRKVAYTMYDVDWFAEYMDFTKDSFC
jgi:hypothetical protein